jgi:hypothetical protein
LSFLCPDPYTGGRTFAVQGKIFSGVGASGKTRPCQGNRKLVKVPPALSLPWGRYPISDHGRFRHSKGTDCCCMATD